MLQEALPQGSLRMRGKGFNGESTREEVAVTTADLNRPERLTEIFFGDNNPDTLHAFETPSGAKIRAHHATGPYTPHHFMLIMHSRSFPDNPQEKPIDTENFYNKILFSRNDQKAYWEILLHGIKGMKEKLGSEYRVFSGGNWLNTYSNFDERNAKTIGLVHDHINGLKKGDLEEYIGKGLASIEGYLEEQAFTNRILPTALPRIQRLMPDDAPKLTARAKDQPPYGYSFVIPADADMDTFTRQMADHHEAYATIAQTMKDRFGRRGMTTEITQPSYNLYIELDEEQNRHITISPTFMGPIGVLESAGVQSKRSLEYGNIVAVDESMRVKHAVVDKVASNVRHSTSERVFAGSN